MTVNDFNVFLCPDLENVSHPPFALDIYIRDLFQKYQSVQHLTKSGKCAVSLNFWARDSHVMCKLVNKQPTTPYPASSLTICCIFSVTALKDGDCDKMFKAGNKIQNLPIYYNPFLFKGKKLLIYI
jgi:hypothetical protein